MDKKDKRDKNKTYRIYVLLNDIGNIKIGITTNFEQRLKSLSGSNGGGCKIVDYYCHPEETYLYSLERIMHNSFKDNRVKGTEWFKGLEFEDVINKLKILFSSESYIRCNELRKRMNERK